MDIINGVIGSTSTSKGSDDGWLLSSAPLQNFNFWLLVEGVMSVPLKSVHAFQKVNQYERIKEGGVNDYVTIKRSPIQEPHQLVVERYMMSSIADPLANGAELTMPLVLGIEHTSKSWSDSSHAARYYAFTGCTVMSKEYGELNAERSGLATEVITIGYKMMYVVPNLLSLGGDPSKAPTTNNMVGDSAVADTINRQLAAQAKEEQEKASKAEQLKAWSQARASENEQNEVDPAKYGGIPQKDAAGNYIRDKEGNPIVDWPKEKEEPNKSDYFKTDEKGNVLKDSNGHDIPKMMRVINAAKKINHPVLIHVHTKKGKGYSYAERRPSFYHGVAPFDVQTGMLLEEKLSRTYADVLSSGLCRMAQTDQKIVAITAAMADGTGLRRFERKFPDRFIDVGIAEEHAITSAAGLATQGYKPYVAIYSTFLQRGFDQILHDVCIQNLPVRLIVTNAGITGNDGMTHQGIFDLSYLGMMPNMTIMAPKNRHEFYQMLLYSQDFDGPLAIRVPKGAASECFNDMDAPISYGAFEMLHSGSKVAILAVGSMVDVAEQMLPILQEKGVDPTIVNARFVKPLDKQGISLLASTHKLLVTLEENVSSGGFGSCVVDYVNDEDLKTKVLKIALPDAFVPHGSRQELLQMNGLDAESIVNKILKRNPK